MTDGVALGVNGEGVRYALAPETPLIWALRDASNLTGTKYGCDTGECGACTVHVDGRATRACAVTLAEVAGSEVTTIEGLAGGRAHPVQQAWIAEQVSQCGFCAPGFIMAIAALLRANPRPAREAVEASITNLCPCGIHDRVRRAVVRAAA